MINDYAEEEEHKRQSNEHSQQQNVLSCPESALTDVKIVENPNRPKDPDVIDLTNLDDEKEYDSGKHDEHDTNKKPYINTRKRIK